MKKVLFVLVLFLFVSLNMHAQSPDPFITLDQDTIVLKISNTDPVSSFELVATLKEDDTDSVVWVLEDPSVIDTTLLELGKVEVKLPDPAIKGESYIYAYSKDHRGAEGAKDSCLVQVIAAIDSVVLYRNDTPMEFDSLVLKMDSSITLKAVIYPDTANLEALTWTYTIPGILDSTVINADSIFKFEAIKKGATHIYVETEGGLKDSCYVHVIVPIDSMVFSQDTMVLAIDSASQLQAFFWPDSANREPLTWSGYDPDIIEITAIDGDSVYAVQPLGLGSTYVYVEAESGKKDTCFVSIILDSVKIDRPAEIDTLLLSLNNVDTLTTIIYPYPATGYDFTWTSSDSATVDILSTPGDSTCVIKGLTADQHATIYLRDSSSYSVDSCVVKVVEKGIEALKLDTLNLTLAKGESYTLKATFTPVDVSNDTITWTLQNPNVVDTTLFAVSDSIRITAKYSGATYVYAISDDDPLVKDSCLVNVYIPIDSIVLNKQQLKLDIDNLVDLKATIYPDTAVKQSLIWTIENRAIADSISMTGDSISHLIAKKAGKMEIRVATADGRHKDTCSVVVDTLHVDRVLLKTHSLNLNIGDSAKLVAQVFPKNATVDTIQWTSQDPSIVAITKIGTDSICEIKGLAKGTAKIYAISFDNSEKKDSCLVTVDSVHVTSVNILISDTLRLEVDSLSKVYAAVLPDNATCDSLDWSVSDPTVIEIISSGRDTVCEIKALSVGSAELYAVSVDGSIKDTCQIKTFIKEVLIEVDTTANNNGRIIFSLLLPDDVSFTGSFKMELPSGFYVLEDSVNMLAPYNAADTIIAVKEPNGNVWNFTVIPKPVTTNAVRLRAGTALKPIASIAYTVADSLNDKTDVYSVLFKDIQFELSDQTEIEETLITVPIKVYVNPTSNDVFDTPSAEKVYLKDNQLYVHSPKAETIYIYSLNGSLLAVKEKSEGSFVLGVNVQEKVLIVSGSSGWSQKVLNQ